MRLRVLVGCEESGRVRDAFLARGHDAMSCDLKPTAAPGPHYHGDVFDVIDYPWDLAILHPECTALAVSGARHFAAKRMDGRQQAALAFVMRLVRRSEHIPRVAIEQPISILSNHLHWPRQIIQPWQFGHGETKATVIYRKNLQPLTPTNIVEGREARVHRMAPGPNRARDRSRTYLGIAEAMAAQWGGAEQEQAA